MTPAVLQGAAALLAALSVLAWPRSARRRWTPGGPRTAYRRRVAKGLWRQSRSAPEPGRGLVPEALELIALALQGGGALGSSVSCVGAVLPGEPGKQLARIGAGLDHGLGADAAWEAAGGHWRAAWRSLRLADAAGVPPGEALTRAAGDLRRSAVADVEVASARLGIRLVVPLGLAYLPAFVLITIVPIVLALTRDLTW